MSPVDARALKLERGRDADRFRIATRLEGPKLALPAPALEEASIADSVLRFFRRCCLSGSKGGAKVVLDSVDFGAIFWPSIPRQFDYRGHFRLVARRDGGIDHRLSTFGQFGLGGYPRKQRYS